MSNHYIKIELERVLKEDLVRHTGIGLMTGEYLNAQCIFRDCVGIPKSARKIGSKNRSLPSMSGRY